MHFEDEIFNVNIVEMFGGEVGLYHNSDITVEGNSLALFGRNQALCSGAINLERKCIFMINCSPLVVFKVIKHFMVELYTYLESYFIKVPVIFTIFHSKVIAHLTSECLIRYL